LNDTLDLPSPALLFYRELIEANIALMKRLAGRVERLRPHAKTHKTREITRLQLAAGIAKQKCATLAEAEMLAGCAVPDVLIAYPLVGLNCGRLARLMAKFPDTVFSVLADHADGIAQLSAAMQSAGQTVAVVLDLDVGQHRTGVPIGPRAIELYGLLNQSKGLKPGGLHVYDGHNNQAELAGRRSVADALLASVLELRDSLGKLGLAVPRIVFGGTPSFPVWKDLDLPEAELSPGTCVLYDRGYGGKFAELSFTPAALLLTRVVSRPTPDRVTFDLGYKAVASDPPAGERCMLLDLPEGRAVIHNEEHLVIETAHAERYRPGDVALAIPTHVCPTVALHKEAIVIANGQAIDRWQIVARDRVLTV
jgi:D-serine deaminase-like pyridoxal phosphate-dependent protein